MIFESDRGGGTQIWLQEFDSAIGALTGDPKKVTTISTEASGGTWSPDGKSLLFLSSVWPDCKDDACNQQRDEERAKSKVKARTYDRLMFRHWSHYNDGKKSHLFIVSIDGGPARDLTPGEFDVPPFSPRRTGPVRFLPRQQRSRLHLQYRRKRSHQHQQRHLPRVRRRRRPPSASPPIPAATARAIYSPDGKYIAYRSQLRGGYESDRFRLMLYDRASGKVTDLSPNFDRWVDSIAWSPDSKTIYLTAGNEGENPIYALHIAQTNPWPEELVDGYNDSPTPTPDGKLLVFNTDVHLRPQRNLHRAADVRAVPHGRAAQLLHRARLPAVQVEAADPHERRATLQGRTCSPWRRSGSPAQPKRKCRASSSVRPTSTRARSIP